MSDTKTKEPLIRIIKRDRSSFGYKVWVRAAAIILALVVDAIFIYSVTGLNPLSVYGVMLNGTFMTSIRFSWAMRDLVTLLCIGTAAASSVAKLDHFIVSNGTLFNQKFHPSALSGREGLEKFVALIRSYFDQKGMHMQFNVVSRETLLDAQAHPENYKHLVVRVAGYSALFTTLSKSLQDDIIRRTEQPYHAH